MQSLTRRSLFSMLAGACASLALPWEAEEGVFRLRPLRAYDDMVVYSLSTYGGRPLGQIYAPRKSAITDPQVLDSYAQAEKTFGITLL